MKELIGSASSIGLMDFTGGGDGGSTVRDASQVAAAALGLKLKLAKYSVPAEIEPAFRALVAEGVNGVMAPGNTAFGVARDRVIAVAAEARMPVLYNNPQIVVLGGMISYSNDLRVMSQRSAFFVDRVVKGARVADVPMEAATPWLAINRKAAQAMGLNIPVSLLVRADEVID